MHAQIVVFLHKNIENTYNIMCTRVQNCSEDKKMYFFISSDDYFLYFCVDMMLFQNPIVWLRRIRCRKGYGVHSPFAFDFVTNVIYNTEKYYAYEEMDSALRFWQKGRVRSSRHLLFRLSNYRYPKTMYMQCADKGMEAACLYGCRNVKLYGKGTMPGVADMIVVDRIDEEALHCIGDGTMLVLSNLRDSQHYWQRIKDDERVTVTFDMYDIGVAFARNDLNKQHYIINW